MCLFSTTCLFEYMYYNRPYIPFDIIQPYVTWRTYDMDKKYKFVNKKKFIYDIKNKLSKNDYVLLENDYPYHVQAKHFILWTELKNVSSIIDFLFQNKTIKWFENPNHYKSIPEIKHYHIFEKIIPKNQDLIK